MTLLGLMMTRFLPIAAAIAAFGGAAWVLISPMEAWRE